MSYVAGHHHRSATTRPASRFSALRWSIAGCAAFWIAVGVGVAQALGD